jgi:hypothetical protein
MSEEERIKKFPFTFRKTTYHSKRGRKLLHYLRGKKQTKARYPHRHP